LGRNILISYLNHYLFKAGGPVKQEEENEPEPPEPFEWVDE
jgi:hypothetical protein